MYTGYKSNVSINKSMSSVNTRTIGGLAETQLESLQREVDNYTRKLEQEKRRFTHAQETYKAVKKQYDAEKDALDTIKKNSHNSETSMLHAKIKNLQANLQKAVNLFDETVANNAKLKSEVDMLRRQKKNYKEIYVSLEQQIRKYEEESLKRLEAIEQKKKRTETLKNQIKTIRKKNAEERANYVEQFEVMERNYLEDKKIREAAKLVDKNQKSESIDTQPILKMRLKKLIAKNKQKVKVIEQYQRNIKQIEQAFEQIKKGSGINDLEEITNTFIKSEEQNYSLYNYVDILSQNIDSLEQQNRQLERKIQQQKLDNQQRKKQLNGTPEEQKRRQQVRNMIKQKQKVVDQLNQLVVKIGPDLQSTLLMLAKSKYNDDPKKLYDYQLGFNLSDRNIEQYLSDLEKYINILVQSHGDNNLMATTKRVDTTETKDIPKTNNAPIYVEEPRDDKELMGERDLKSFASEYIDRKKGKLKD